MVYRDYTSKTWSLYKFIDGGISKFVHEWTNESGSIVSPIVAVNGDKIRGECYSDGTIKVFLNGVILFEVNDKDHMAYTQRIGFGGSETAVKLDDFKIEAISAP